MSETEVGISLDLVPLINDIISVASEKSELIDSLYRDTLTLNVKCSTSIQISIPIPRVLVRAPSLNPQNVAECDYKIENITIVCSKDAAPRIRIFFTVDGASDDVTIHLGTIKPIELLFLVRVFTACRRHIEEWIAKTRKEIEELKKLMQDISKLKLALNIGAETV